MATYQVKYPHTLNCVGMSVIEIMESLTFRRLYFLSKILGGAGGIGVLGYLKSKSDVDVRRYPELQLSFLAAGVGCFGLIIRGVYQMSVK